MRGASGALVLAGLIAGEMNGNNDERCKSIIGNLNKFADSRKNGSSSDGDLAGAIAIQEINDMMGVPLLDKALIDAFFGK